MPNASIWLLDIRLDQPCDHTGLYLSSGEKCPRCNGTGFILTPDGEAIKAFYERHIQTPEQDRQQ